MEFYLIFSLSTAIFANLEIISPIISRLTLEHPESVLVEYKYIFYIVTFTLFVLLAPVIFLITIVPSSSMAFTNAIYKELRTIELK